MWAVIEQCATHYRYNTQGSSISLKKYVRKNNIFLDAESIRNKLFHWTGPPVQDSKERSEFDMLF